MKKKVLISCCFVITGLLSFAEPKLEDYLSNDLELQRLALEVKKAELSTKMTGIENGIDIQLSTGKATLSFNDKNFPKCKSFYTPGSKSFFKRILRHFNQC